MDNSTACPNVLAQGGFVLQQLAIVTRRNLKTKITGSEKLFSFFFQIQTLFLKNFQTTFTVNSVCPDLTLLICWSGCSLSSFVDIIHINRERHYYPFVLVNVQKTHETSTNTPRYLYNGKPV